MADGVLDASAHLLHGPCCCFGYVLPPMLCRASSQDECFADGCSPRSWHGQRLLVRTPETTNDATAIDSLRSTAHGEIWKLGNGELTTAGTATTCRAPTPATGSTRRSSRSGRRTRNGLHDPREHSAGRVLNMEAEGSGDEARRAGPAGRFVCVS